MLRGTYIQVPLFLYIAINGLPQTESFLYQTSDGADQPDRAILYCGPGEDRIGAVGLRAAFFRDASTSSQFPGTAFSLPQKPGGAGIRFAIDRFAGGSALSRGLTDHQSGRRLAAVQTTGIVFRVQSATMDLG